MGSGVEPGRRLGDQSGTGAYFQGFHRQFSLTLRGALVRCMKGKQARILGLEPLVFRKQGCERRLSNAKAVLRLVSLPLA